jgi:endonuclease G
MDWQGISINELAQITGIDPFPSVPAEVKAVAMPLPAPQPHLAVGYITNRRVKNVAFSGFLAI